MKSIKITFIILLISLLSASSSFGQVKIGPKVGVNLATFSGADKPDDLKMHLGLNGGIAMNYAPSEIFGIQVELLYEQKGSAAKDATDQYEEFTVETTDYKWLLNYLTLPMMAKVSFGSGARFFIEAGPYFGYLLSAKMKGTAKFMNPTNPDQNHTDDVDTDIYDSFKKFDFGLVGGIGVKVPAGSNMMVFGDARYNYGLAKLDSDGNAKMFNSAIGISVGVLFDISK